MSRYDMAQRIRADYGLFDKPQDFERGALTGFDFLHDGQLILASGSPRNIRAASVVNENSPSLVQLSSGAILERLKPLLDGEFAPIVKSILDYEEPKRHWRYDKARHRVTDQNLSLNKARLVAVAAILLQIQSGKALPENFTVIGKDNNVATWEGEFMDRAGYTTGFEPLLTSWARTGEGAKPIEPVDQIVSLYFGAKKPPPYFIIANSTTVLHCSLGDNQATIDDLLVLADFNHPLPDMYRAKTNYTFVALRPTKEGVEGVLSLWRV